VFAIARRSDYARARTNVAHRILDVDRNSGPSAIMVVFVSRRSQEHFEGVAVSRTEGKGTSLLVVELIAAMTVSYYIAGAVNSKG
jgi:hypothetical protein